MIAKCALLFYVFFKIGLFSFGGGYAMLPMIYKEIATFGFMPVREFSDLVALSQMTPGPIAVNAATYVGFQYAGITGAAAATAGIAMPSFIIIAAVITFLSRFKKSAAVQGVFSGIRPATAGMIASAVVFISQSSIVNDQFFSRMLFTDPLTTLHIPSLIIFFLVLFFSKKWTIFGITISPGPVLLTILAGILGAFIL